MKQKLTLLFLCFAMVLSLCTFFSFGTFAEDAGAAWDGSVATAYAGGSGTPEDPYQIANGAQLALMAQQVNAGEHASASFLLTKDVNLANIAWTPIGISLEMPFSGSFDGDGKTISGLAIETSDAALYAVGLFGVLDGATVSNLTLNAGSVKGQYYVGALAGMAQSSTVSRVSNDSVNVKAQTKTPDKTYAPYAGGIIGALKVGASVSDCHSGASATISAFNNNADSAYIMYSRAGGIVGDGNAVKDNSANIFYCTSAATVQTYLSHDSQYQRAGGIIGSTFYTDVVGCYSTATVKANAKGYAQAGGIVGYAEVGAVTSNISKATIMTNTVVEGFSQSYNQSHVNGGIVGHAGHGNISPAAIIKNNLSMATQIIGKDTDVVARVCTKFTGGGRNNASYNYYTAYEINGVAVPGFVSFYNGDEVKNGNFAVTEAQLNGTATENIDTVNSNPKYANTASVILAMNRFAKDNGFGSATVVYDANEGPVIFGVYEENYLVNVAPTENGTVVLEGKPAIFPEGYAELVSGYKEGQNVVVSLAPAEGYVPYKLEYTYNGETVELQKDELGKYSFVMPAGEVTLSAIFVEAGASTELKVVFLGKDGAIIDEQIVSYKGAATAPEAPVVEGYDFIGWDIAFDEVKTDLVVNAVYQIQTYTVIFLDSQGNVLSEQAVDYGFAAVPPEAPAVEGHVFGGWDCAFDFVKGDMTITATYKKVYTVTFLGFGGVALGEPQSVVVGESAVAPEAPAVSGYEFEGWDVDFTCITGDLTVNAVYAFSGNFFSGGKGTENNPYQLANAADLLTLRDYIADETKSEIFVSAYYILTADIDLADETYNNEIVKDKNGVITQTWTPISTFSGVFDGNGYTISNLTNKTQGGTIGFFAYLSGTVKNLTFKDANIPNATWDKTTAHAILAVYASGSLTIENVHIVDGKLGGYIAGFFIAKTQNSEITIKESTVSGTVTDSNQNGGIGGFIGNADSANVTIEDCVCTLSTKTPRNLVALGGYIGIAGTGTATIDNCIAIVNLATSSTGKSAPVAGFIGSSSSSGGTINISNCSVYGTLENHSTISPAPASGIIADKANNVHVTITNCLVSGKITSVNGYASGIIGTIGRNGSAKVENTIVLATVEGVTSSAVVGKIDQKGCASANVYTLTDIPAVGEILSTCTGSVPTVTVLTSLTTLPEGLSSDVWAIDAMPVISGVSVSLGNNMSINVLAKYGIVLKAHAAKELYVNGELASNATVTEIGGATYAMFVYDGFKVADMDKALVLSLVHANAPQKEYSITDYLTNIYGAENGKYQSLIDAMLYYGDAAQKAKYGTSTVLASASLKLEKEFAAEYIETNFATANLKTHPGLSAAGVALNLYGNITPILKVDASVSEVTVSYNGKTATMATQLAVDEDGNEYAYVVYTELLATSLNNLMTVSYTLDGEEVTFDTNVAMYIETALATQDLLTEDEANLAKALAVYMRAARTFVGLD